MSLLQLRIISFTEKGAALCQKLLALCKQHDISCQGYTMAKWADTYQLLPVSSLSVWAQEGFAAKANGACDGLIFIGATGIAVRAIAPYLVHKTKDPAVLSVDERGRFVVPLVAGHIGGANGLAVQVAQWLGATPVISTATDINGCFAVDVWAAEQGYHIVQSDRIKDVSAALLAGETVGLYSDFPIRGSLPPGIQLAKSGRVGIVISYQTEKMLFQNTLVLVPQRLSLGIGCRKGAAVEQIAQAVETVCTAFSYPLTAICEAASIDLKAEEAGLLAFCQKLRVPVRFYSAEVLRQVQGNFSASSFVAGVTGVDNVCERAAIKSSGGRLLVPKQVVHSVTVALAERAWEVDFGY